MVSIPPKDVTKRVLLSDDVNDGATPAEVDSSRLKNEYG